MRKKICQKYLEEIKIILKRDRFDSRDRLSSVSFIIQKYKLTGQVEILNNLPMEQRIKYWNAINKYFKVRKERMI